MLPRDDHDRTAMNRREAHQVDNSEIWVVTREDFILQKLKAGRSPYPGCIRNCCKARGRNFLAAVSGLATKN
jgi:hypothetical protein